MHAVPTTLTTLFVILLAPCAFGQTSVPVQVADSPAAVVPDALPAPSDAPAERALPAVANDTAPAEPVATPAEPVATPAVADDAAPAAADDAAPPSASSAAIAAPSAASAKISGPTQATDSPVPIVPEPAPAPTRPLAKIEIGGYAKAGFGYQQADPVVDYIGHSNGFQMAGARLEIVARPVEAAEVVLSVEGALDRPEDKMGVSGEKLVSLRDAYLKYEFFPFVVVTLGQFKAPFSAEALVSDSDLVFFDRSIATRGLLPPEGYAAEGLTLDRQVGLSLSSTRLALGPIGLRYALGVFNGNGANRLLNDNQDLTPVGRIAVDFQDMVAVGFAAYQNPRTVGERPDLLQEKDTAFTADLSADIAGVRVLAAYTTRQRDYLTIKPQPPSDDAWSALAQISWRHEGTGIEPAYRFALLNPSKLAGFEQVTHHTIGLNWKPSDKPLRVFAAYTLRREKAERKLTNDGVSLGAQLNF
ncbi:MAG: porin [Myxococcales bacterium]|jgi:hypothetical protein